MWLHKLLPLSGMGNSDQLLLMLFSYASVNSTCAQPPAPCPRATAGHLPAMSVPGVGHLQILHRPGAGHLPTPGPFPSFWHARDFLSEYNLHRRFYWKKKQIGSSVKDRNKLKRVVKACSRFYACISSSLIKPELHSENWSYRCDSTFSGYWIKFLLILFKDHTFIVIKLFIRYNFTALY